MKHLNEEQLILFHYGEGSTSEAAAHLDSCEDCRNELETLRRVLRVADEFAAPERGPDYGNQVWDRLESQLPKQRFLSWRFFDTRNWMTAGAFAMFLLAAFLTGRFWDSVPKVDDGVNPAAQQRILLVAVGDHLEQAQMMLVEIANADGGEDFDASAQLDLASELVKDNRLYRQAAVRSGQATVADVLEQLEMFLLDVSHSPESLSAGELSDLQEQIESGDLIFRVKIVGSSMKDEELNRARQLARQDL